MMLSPEELLAGSTLTHDVDIPPELLPAGGGVAARRVALRPLSVRDLQRIDKAARDDESLSAALMIKQALAEPTLSVEQVMQLPAGLGRFLVERINHISGIDTPQDALEEYVQAPLARACFILAREFGWTPEEVSGMTIGQILLYLEMARREGKDHGAAD
ncbi:hypothetical protein [Geoalkalibacter halelectricus]|uniref:Phage tail assembly chaperone protein, E, or 41 or 14 n=1 Tax=Geoalkalibacter halelectricus TaxID=2847045 RepID=A0ABY5ZUP5_9BACT|nr:hypothetical protein [Geoalkalibacter halelectricus]MDO3379171.1 hypothetical protein [Geoalkalibacter halelectricus]UWZ80931.1 hypothetical protein L9S41_05875 [Geoalkalibacter halelectricus]